MPTLTAFHSSPDRGQGFARDMIVRWALEEAGVSYDVRTLTFKQLKEPAFYAINPFGQIPAYENGDLKLFESGAIVLHIAEAQSCLLPSNSSARSRVVAWMFAAVSTVDAPIMDLSLCRMLEKDKPWFEERQAHLQTLVRRRLSEISNALGPSEWLEETFSAGDLMIVASLRRLKKSGLLTDYQNVSEYIARAEARPAFQRAFAAQLATFNETSQADDSN